MILDLDNWFQQRRINLFVSGILYFFHITYWSNTIKFCDHSYVCLFLQQTGSDHCCSDRPSKVQILMNFKHLWQRKSFFIGFPQHISRRHWVDRSDGAEGSMRAWILVKHIFKVVLNITKLQILEIDRQVSDSTRSSNSK